MRRAAVAQVVKAPDGRDLAVEVTGHPAGRGLYSCCTARPARSSAPDRAEFFSTDSAFV